MEKRETPQERYEKKNVVRITFKVRKTTEPDILEKLESVENKSGYIKSLIRADIEKNK